MSDNEDWGKEYSKLADLYAIKCNEVRELKEKNKQIREEVIEEITQKVEFEEKWLFDCYIDNNLKYLSKDVNIAFNAIKHSLRKLKENK